MPTDVHIPPALLAYLRPPTLERTEKTILRFRQRMNYLAEIAEEVVHWMERMETPVFSLLDYIEVDLLVILASGLSDTDTVDSTYILHCSWTSECSKAAMYESLPKSIRSVLTKGVGKILMGEREAEAWVSQWGSTMGSLLARFSNSKNLNQAIGSMLAMDIMLMNMWSFVAAMRLNPMLED